MHFLKTLTKKIVDRVIKPELDAIRKDLGSKVAEAVSKANAAVKEVRELRAQLTSLQAMDIGFHERGKVVVLARINGKDRVKIIETKPSMTVQEYKNLSETILRDYGARANFVDAPMGGDIRII